MKNTVLRPNLFSIYDRSGITAYLKKMASKGWLICDMGIVFWKFRRIEPQSLDFSVVYNRKGKSYDFTTSDYQQGFADMALESGWKLAAATSFIQVFYNESSDAVPMQTDPVAELKGIDQIMIRAFGYSFLVIALLLIQRIVTYNMDLRLLPIDLLSTAAFVEGWIILLVLLALFIIGAAVFLIWRLLAARGAAAGNFTKTPPSRLLNAALLVIVCAGIICMLYCGYRHGGTQQLYSKALAVAFTAAVVILALAAVSILRKKSLSPAINRTIVGAVSVAGVIVFSFVLLLVSDTITKHSVPAETVPEDIALTLDDIYETDPEDTVVTEVIMKESALLSALISEQELRQDPGTWIKYRLTEIKSSLFKNWMTRKILRAFSNSYRITENESFWGADKALMNSPYTGQNEYALFYGNYILEIEFSQVPTTELKAKVGEVMHRMISDK